MGYSNVAGELNVYGTSSLSDLILRANCLQYGDLTNLGTTTLNKVIASNLTVTGNFSITATNTSVTNSLSINNLATSTALKVVQFETGGPGHSHNVAEFWDYTTLAMVIDPEGNVGIHTTSSPGYALTVGAGGSYLHTVHSDFYSGNASGLSNIIVSNLIGALNYTQLQNIQTNVTTVGELTSLNVASTVNGAAAFFTTANVVGGLGANTAFFNLARAATMNALSVNAYDAGFSNLTASNLISYNANVLSLNVTVVETATLLIASNINSTNTLSTTNVLASNLFASDGVYGAIKGTNTVSASSLTLTTPLAIANGGTGQTTSSAAFNALSPMSAAGDVIYGGASGVGTRLAAGTSTQILHSGATPSWSAVSLTADVSGTLPIANGGTGQTTSSAAFNALSPMSAAGDLIYGGASGAASRLAAGTSTQILHGGTTPSWASISLSADVSGTLPISSGGTGQTTATAAFNAISPITTLGDLIYGSAPNTSARLQGSTTSEAVVLTQTGTGAVSAAPSWRATTGTGSVVLATGPTLSGTITGGTFSGTHTGDGSGITNLNMGAAASGTLAIARGGTGQTTAQLALNALAGSTTSGRYLRGDGTNVTMSTISAADVPTLNQNTTGTAAGLSTTLAIGSGGTGQTTAQTALNALAASTTSGYYLRGNGTNVVMAAISAADVPTLNQNTTGTAAGLSTTLAIGSGGTGQTSKAAAYNALTPITTLGDLIYGSGTNAASRLAGSTVSTMAVLTQTGTGTISAAPTWTGTTGTGSVVLSASPTLSGTITGGTFSGTHTGDGSGITSLNMVNAGSGTLAVARGGTGLATYTVGDLLYASGATTLASLADVATGSALISGGLTTAPSWGKIGLTTHVSGTLPIANGGTGQTTAQLALNALAGSVTSGRYLRGDGTNVTMSAISAADVPTLNQNTTGTAAGLSTTLAVGSGGTGQTTAQLALNALAGSVTSGRYLRGDGTNVTMSAISAADVPTLNQNTTGTAAGLSTTLAISSGGTGQTTAQLALNALAASTTSGYYLRGNGTNVVMAAISAADVPTLNQNTTGTAAGLSTTLAIGSGGTGQTTAQTALNALAGSVTSGRYLRGDGTNVTMSTISSTDLPVVTFSPGAAGTYGNSTSIPVITVDTYGRITGISTSSASGGFSGLTQYGVAYASSTTSIATTSSGTAGQPLLSGGSGAAPAYGTLGLAYGGTGQTTAQLALNALAASTTSGYYLRGNGTNVVMAAISAADVPTLNQNTTGTAAGLSTTLAITSGGTGQTTAQTALNALAASTTSGYYLRGNGTNVVMASISSTDLPVVTFSPGAAGTYGNSTSIPVITVDTYGRITGISTSSASGGFSGLTQYGVAYASSTTSIATTAAGTAGQPLLSGGSGAAPAYGTLGLAYGGTGQTSAQLALNALAASVTSGYYLRGNGTNVVMAAISAADVPTLNQNTTGTAAGLSTTLAITSGGTGQTSKAAAYNALTPITTLGDLIYGSGTNAASRLAGSTASTIAVLTQTGTGTVSAAPTWSGTTGTGSVVLSASPTLSGTITGGTFSGTHTGDGSGITSLNMVNAGSGTLAVARGGTGLATYTVGDLLYASGATTLASLADVATGSALISGGLTTAPTWGKIGLTTHVSGTLPIASGGTGQTTAQLALNSLAGSATSGYYLRGNGTNVVMASISSTDLPVVTFSPGAAGTYGNSTSIPVITVDTYGRITGISTSSASGGGFSGLTQYGVAYASSTTSIATTAAGAAGQPLLSGGSGAAPAYGTLGIAYGGTGQTSAQLALNALAASVTSGYYLRGNGTNVVMAAISAADVPTLNQNTTGTAAGLSTTLAIGSGGTGQTTAQLALNALAASVTSGYYLRGNGTNVVMAAISAADVPTLNQNTTGTAAGLSTTLAITSGGTGQTSKAAAYNALTPITTLGDLIYGSGTNAASRLAGSTSSTIAVLTQTGTGTVSAAPTWSGTTGTGSVVLSASPTLSGTATMAAIACASVTASGVVTAGSVTSSGAVTCASVSSAGLVTCAGTLSSSTIKTSYTQGTNTLASGQAYFANPTNTAGQCASCVVAIGGALAGTTGAAYFGYNVTSVNGYSHGITGASQNLVFRASGDMTGTSIFTMDRTGGFTALQDVTAYSDARIKTDIQKIEGALDKVSRIGGYTYTRTDSVCKGKRQAGVLAQEMLEVLPEVVGTNEETGYYTVSYGNITALLIEALKEERQHREALEERLARLEKLLVQE